MPTSMALDKIQKVKSLNYQGQNTIFNVGIGIKTSVNELYQLIAEKINKKIEPKFSLARAGDLEKSCLDFGQIKKELAWQPKYSLEEGLKERVKRFENQSFLKK